MDKDYLISVIVPIYNVEYFVRKCIESITNQTYRNLQIILIDNNSTDCSGQICDEYANTDNRIQVIHQEYNKGLVCSIKTGLNIAKGDFVGIVYGDDWIDEVMYEDLIEEIISTHSDFAVVGNKLEGWGCEASFGYAKGVFELTNENRYAVIHNQFFSSRINGTSAEDLAGLGNKLFDRERLRKAYMQVPDYATLDEDGICLIAILMEAKRFVMTGRIRYHYVRRDGSLMNTININLIDELCSAHRGMQEVLKKYDCYDEFMDDNEKAFNIDLKNYIARLVRDNISVGLWHFSDIGELFDKKIIVYGAGDVGRDYYIQICKYERCNIVAWLDSNYAEYHYDYCEIQGIHELKILDYDVIVVAVWAEEMAKSIINTLCETGVERDKIIWKKPQKVWQHIHGGKCNIRWGVCTYNE